MRVKAARQLPVADAGQLAKATRVPQFREHNQDGKGSEAKALITIYSGSGFLVDRVLVAAERFTFALPDATLQ
ncbi:MAG: hypothetical protein ABSA02_22640 [Trebonia sp.]